MIDTLQRHIDNASEEMDFTEFEALAKCGETKRVERKSQKIYRNDKNTREHLTKAASAFSNYDGGFLLFSVKDDGTIEDGVPLKKENTTYRDWLVSIIENNGSPTLTNYAVKTVKLNDGKNAYVVVFGPSDNAPHQASDNRYYCRLDGKFKPIDGRMVQDIYDRQKKPILELSYKIQKNHQGNDVLTFILNNMGNVYADDVFLIGELSSSFQTTGMQPPYLTPLSNGRKRILYKKEIIYPCVPERITIARCKKAEGDFEGKIIERKIGSIPVRMTICGKKGN